LITIIADSGSTKTDWSIHTDNEELTITTSGINPIFMNSDEIYIIFKEVLDLIDRNKEIKLFYYGASCSSDCRKKVILDALSKDLPQANIFVDHDLIGAAKASCGTNMGITCILGTGSNSCLYDGTNIIKSIGGHGFILGDEGSGANIGKRLVRLYMEDALPTEIVSVIKNDYHLDRNAIIEKVYKGTKPNQFLASLAPIVANNQSLHFIAIDSIDLFIQKHILKYKARSPIYFVGSIAYYFQDIIKALFIQYNLILGGITAKPIEGLKNYHITNELH
jgi:N-acetylglucosamine kinase-like BadF-type ATPase